MKPLTTVDEAIRDQVRDHYGKLAIAGESCCDSSCCSPQEINSHDAQLYTAQDLIDVPAAAAQNSHGCGNPNALASLKPGEIVVDLGSGAGLDVFIAAQRVGATGTVYGVDMTDEMLTLARRNALSMGVTNVEFRKGTIEDLPLRDSSADVIISNCVVNLSPDKAQVMREALRVLKPGGRIAISDIVIDGTLDDLPVSEADVRKALNWAGCIAGALTIEQFTRILEDAGFEAIDIEVKHRYSLEELGQSLETLDVELTPQVAAELVDRFTSSNISARRPH